MSAKFLHTLSDEHQKDLQKQIGCMNGLFQLFNRHHFLSSSKHITGHKPRRVPSGGSCSQRTESSGTASQKSTEQSHKKAVKEKQRNSFESSRSSFSSSSCSSSFSSVECSRTSQLDTAKPSFGQTNFLETPSRPSDACSHSRKQSVDLREVVKDFIHRDARTISVKPGTKDAAGRQTLKYMDSPRPSHQTISLKGRDAGLIDERQDSHVAFARRDAPRLSYDGRESREKLKSSVKLKELPRLSLDSRERSMRSSSNEMSSNVVLNQQQDFGSHKRSSSVVAKLMGLEVLSNSESITGNRTPQLGRLECVISSQLTGKNSRSESPRNGQRESISPQQRIPDLIKKPTAGAKFPIEPAPWKQGDGRNQKPAPKCQETSRGSNSSLSVYGEIEKRLEELEFKKSGKDLRALKQILAAMQKTKEALETKKEHAASNFVSQPNHIRELNAESKSSYTPYKQSSRSVSPTIKTAGSPRSFKSTMETKAAKLLEKDNATINPIICAKDNDGVQRLQCGSPGGNRKDIVNRQRAKDLSPRINVKDLGSRYQHPVNRNPGARISPPPSPLAKEPQPINGKNINSSRSSGTASPRLQHKKPTSENQSRPTTSSSESSRIKKQPSNRQSASLGSPRRSQKPKPQTLQPRYEELSKLSSDVHDTTSISSDNSSSFVSHFDTEVTSANRVKITDDRVLAIQCKKQQSPEARIINDKLMEEPTKAVVEQPSPISVLDAPFYEDELPSPVKKKRNAYDGESFTSDEEEWTPRKITYLSTYSKSNASSAVNHGDADNIKHLTLDFIKQEDAHGVTINNTTISNHEYILEILSASGLIRDLESDNFTVKADVSGCVINPKFFVALEETKRNTEEHYGRRYANSHHNEKFQRALVFDVVNEILYRKLVLEDVSAWWLSPRKLAGKRPKGQQVLSELCSEIDHLQADCNGDDDDDIFKSISDESLDWPDWRNEAPGLVLDIERLIFKDLIGEVVTAVTAKQRGQPRGHCRQLFSK